MNSMDPDWTALVDALDRLAEDARLALRESLTPGSAASNSAIPDGYGV
jgi:hypothetical protein